MAEMSYRLTSEATEDVIHIYGEGVRLFGVAQAEKYQDELEERFELLVSHPRMARERSELTPPVRINPFGSHIFVYRVEDDDAVLIVRVRHGRENWTNDPIG